MKKALSFGILSAFFFAFTFICNRSMNLGGGYWLWGACLRYFFTLPLMGLIVWRRKKLGIVWKQIRDNLPVWLLWSTVGFGLFYAPLSSASVYGESWFVAATWQITIVCGILLTPLFGRKIPLRNLTCSVVILAGIFLLQTSHMGGMQMKGTVTAFLLILVAAVSYPLGNRKMMQHVPEDFSTAERVFAMTLCSIPFWIVLAVYGMITHGGPSGGQAVQSFIVALFSGVIATLLFFEATNLVKHNPKQLAVIEATQSGEVLFTLLGGILFLGDQIPDTAGMIGIAVIVTGMVLNSLASAEKTSD